jgi:hypothetical protein
MKILHNVRQIDNWGALAKNQGLGAVLQSRIIFMRLRLGLRLRVKILMRLRLRRLRLRRLQLRRLRLRLLPYCIARQNF